MGELKRCPFCGEEAKNDRFAPNMVFCPDGLSGAEAKKCYNDAILSIEDWNTRPIEDELRAEIEHLTSYCDRLADGYPDGMLPTDIQIIKDANWTFAQQLHEANEEIERLRAAHQTILRTTGRQTIYKIAREALKGSGG